MPESEGSNVETPTGESNEVYGGLGKAGKDMYDRNYAVGQKMQEAKDQGKSY